MNKPLLVSKTILDEINSIVKKTNIEENDYERFKLMLDQIDNTYFTLCFNTINNINVFDIINFHYILRFSEDYYQATTTSSESVQSNTYIINEFCKIYAKSKFNSYPIMTNLPPEHEKQLLALANYQFGIIINIVMNLILTNEYYDAAVEKYKYSLVKSSNYSQEMIKYYTEQLDFVIDTMKFIITDAFLKFSK
jgi:hypothetical protein